MGDPLSDPRAQGAAVGRSGRDLSVGRVVSPCRRKPMRDGLGRAPRRQRRHLDGCGGRRLPLTAGQAARRSGQHPDRPTPGGRRAGHVRGASGADPHPVRLAGHAADRRALEPEHRLKGGSPPPRQISRRPPQPRTQPQARPRLDDQRPYRAAGRRRHSGASCGRRCRGSKTRGAIAYWTSSTRSEAAPASRISDAGGRAPSHHWWQSAFSAVGNFVKDAAVDIGKSVWNLVSGKTIMDFIRHPWLGDARRAGEGHRDHSQLGWR